jgi:hypothetical protein
MVLIGESCSKEIRPECFEGEFSLIMGCRYEIYSGIVDLGVGRSVGYGGALIQRVLSGYIFVLMHHTARKIPRKKLLCAELRVALSGK